MALINNLYVFVVDENVSYGGESSSHPVEKGVPISDHYESQPTEISLSGKIVDHSGSKAKDIFDQLRKLQTEGSLVTYTGRNSLGNMQIQSISTSSPNTNFGGYDIDISLKEIRVAKESFDASKSSSLSTSSQQVEKGESEDVYHTVVKGDCVWSLVITGPYKNLKPTYSKPMDKCNWVMSQNQDAFSRPNDFKTLQIGKRILVGTKS